MKPLVLVLAAALALTGLTGCTRAQMADVASAANVIPAPVEVANRTKLDEQAGITVTLAYVALNKAAGLLIETGLITDQATIHAIGAADAEAIEAVRGVREAYLAANAEGYTEAITKANGALKRLSALLPARS